MYKFSVIFVTGTLHKHYRKITQTYILTPQENEFLML
jgi:hypothetical protein